MNQVSNPNWDRERLRDPHGQADKKVRVQRMFAQVAGTYDKVNHIISFNCDRRWRRVAVRAAGTGSPLGVGASVVDVCCGTGDMALTFARLQPALEKITGVDFVEGMLSIAQQKSDAYREQCDEGPAFEWICGDAESIALPDESYDYASCVFGVRNLQRPQTGISEMARLLKPGGRLIILEFDLPKNPLLRWSTNVYFRWGLPLIGGLFSRDRDNAYRYLPESVASFETAQRVPEWMEQAGLQNLQTRRLNLGTVVLFTADKPSCSK